MPYLAKSVPSRNRMRVSVRLKGLSLMSSPILNFALPMLFALMMSVTSSDISLAAPAPDTAQAAMARAVAAEASQDWTGAASAYREAAQAASGADPAAARETLRRIAAEAERSIPLMTSRAKLGAGPADGGPAYFLGVDHTVGANWHGTLGREGWVLFGSHGDDLAGGPRLLDGTFAYTDRVGEPGHGAFRWRDPPAYPGSHPKLDLALADPVAPGDRVVSFLDDGGESWTANCGPDIYVDVTIPAGRHLLTFPLHFSGKGTNGHRYNLYLLAQTSKSLPASAAPQNGVAAPVSCLSSLYVSVADTPGCVRAAVQGPAHYTLVVRRLDSLNANLPALFLDPDPRTADPPRLAAELFDSELQEAAVTLTGRAGRLNNPNVGDLQRLMDRYALPTHDWKSLGDQADLLAADTTRSQAERTIAALIAWHAQEQLPLQTGHTISVFARYLSLRFGPRLDESLPRADAGSGDRQTGLMDLSRELHKTGHLRLAELADNYVWDMEIRQALPSDTSQPSDPSALYTAVKQAWHDVAQPYLTDEELWLWDGVGGAAPRPVAIAQDADYAAQKAGSVTAALLAGTPAAWQTGPVTIPHSLPTDSTRFWVRVWINEVSAAAEGPVPPLTIALPVGTSLYLRQSRELMVYIGACRPLLPPGAFQYVHPGTPPPMLPRIPNMLPNDMEELARAYLNQDVFPTDRTAQSKADAVALLASIVARYPQYARLDLVQGLLAGEEMPAPAASAPAAP